MHNREVLLTHLSVLLSVRMIHLRNYAQNFNKIWYFVSTVKPIKTNVTLVLRPIGAVATIATSYEGPTNLIKGKVVPVLN
jgi:hypothetical protein